MTPGSRPWVVRALADWVVETRQGLALATYQADFERERAVRELTVALHTKGLTVIQVRCSGMDGAEFSKQLAAADADAILVLDQEPALFGSRWATGSNGHEVVRFWLNFTRERITEHKGAQIWWFTPSGATRFSQTMPDLARFFLFRQDLEIEPETVIPQFPTEIFDIGPEAAPAATASARAEDFLARAIHAASQNNPDYARIWVGPATQMLTTLLDEGMWESAVSSFEQLRSVTCDPELVLRNASRVLTEAELCRTYLLIAEIRRRVGDLADARLSLAEATRLAARLVEAEPENEEFLRALGLRKSRQRRIRNGEPRARS